MHVRPGDSLQKFLWKLVESIVICVAAGAQFACFCSAAEMDNSGNRSSSTGNFNSTISNSNNSNSNSTGSSASNSASTFKTLKLLPDSVQKFAKIAVAQENNLQHVTLVDPRGYGAAAGILAGDEVLQAQLNGDFLILKLKRNGKPYQTSINLNNPALNSTNKPFELAVTSTDSAEDTSNRIPRPGTISQSQRMPYQAQADDTSLSSNSNRSAIPVSLSPNALIDPQAFSSPLGQMAPKSPFNLNANTSAVALQTDRFGRPILDVNAPGQLPVIDVNSPLRILANYQLELIVDQSLSMGKNDCPGGLTRWDWCGAQAADLSRAINSFVPEGLTITAFNEGFRVHKNVSPQDIITLFQTGKRHWGTQLAEPLADRLNSYFKYRSRNPKPLLIAVITDGIPFPQPEPEMVVQELVKATKQMSNPFEVTVIFFQIGGNDRFGHKYLQYLDQNLFRDGARFHLVHTFPFEQLQRIGLANALVRTMQTYGQAR